MFPHRLYIGTVGEGIFRSLDGGESFLRACDGMFVECHVRSLVLHPKDSRTIYAGTEQGLFVSRDGADNWSRVESPINGLQIWSILVHPKKPDVILVGTCPSRIFRSDDGGRSWAESTARLRLDCPRIIYTRVTTLVADPDDLDAIWAGVEIDGIFRSRDAGRSFEPIGQGLSSQDIHALAIVSENGKGRRMLAATNNDLNLSEDSGATWKPLSVGKTLPWNYCRSLKQPVRNSATLLLGTGNAPPGFAGSIARSTDAGRSWQLANMPHLANSTVWTFATHEANADLVYAASVSGQVYRSWDRGAMWEKMTREFGEIRALAWAPG